MVTHQLQVERRTGKVCRSKTDVLPTVPRNQPRSTSWYSWDSGSRYCYAAARSVWFDLDLFIGHLQLSFVVAQINSVLYITQNQSIPMSKRKTHLVDWCKYDPVHGGYFVLVLAHFWRFLVTSEESSNSLPCCRLDSSQRQRKSSRWYTLLYIHQHFLRFAELHRVRERIAYISSNLNSMQYTSLQKVYATHVQSVLSLNKLKIYHKTNKLVSTRLTQ